MTSPQKTNSKKQKARLGRTVDRPYWILMLSIVIRALHQVGAAVFLTVFLVGDMGVPPDLYIGLASVTGIVLLLTEGLRHRQIFREVSGIVTVFKLLIIGLAYHKLIPDAPAVLFVFLMASFFSHAPKTIRHRLLF